MAFRIRPDEAISDGLRRIAVKSLKTAHEALRRTVPPGDEAIHEARKSVKKVRAIVDAIEEDDGQASGKSRKRLRRVNRVLSPLRDVEATLTTLSELRRREPRLFTEHTFARLRRELSQRKREAMAAFKRDGWKRVGRDLRLLRASAKRWHLAHRGFRALEAALRTTHREGRRALEEAERTQDAADFHELRKQIKALWYELRLLEQGGGIIRRHIAALHRAEACLGDEHNVVVLCAELSKNASLFGRPVDLRRFTAAANRYQCELRGKAIASARPIYGHKSRDYVRAIERAWKSGRHGAARVRPHRRAA